MSSRAHSQTRAVVSDLSKANDFSRRKLGRGTNLDERTFFKALSLRRDALQSFRWAGPNSNELLRVMWYRKQIVCRPEKTCALLEKTIELLLVWDRQSI